MNRCKFEELADHVGFAQLAVEMVGDFCKKYKISGSTGNYDLYQGAIKMFREELEKIEEDRKFWKQYDKNWKTKTSAVL